MSIASKLEKLETDIANAYLKISQKGGTIPQDKNTENLADAIDSLADVPHYTELEYIESTGTQYVDTRIIPNLNTKIYIRFNYGDLTQTKIIFGCKNVNSNYYQLYKGNNQEKLAIAFGIDNVQNLSYLTEDFTNKDMIFVCDKNGYSINHNNYSYLVNPTSNGFTSLGLFARHNPNDWSLFSQIKLYSFRIYENGVLLRSFIPVKDENNVVCLFDKVSGDYFYNQGTGSFIAGPEI